MALSARSLKHSMASARAREQAGELQQGRVGRVLPVVALVHLVHLPVELALAVLVQPLPRPLLDPLDTTAWGWSSSAVSIHALSTSAACQCDPISTVIVHRPRALSLFRSSGLIDLQLLVVVAVPTEIDLI